MEPQLSLADWHEAERLLVHRLEHRIEARHDVVLISQLQRSGGTLTNRLLDGHPELLVHAYELHLGTPKHVWPSFDLAASCDDWFVQLREGWIERVIRNGYTKNATGEPAAPPLPMLLAPSTVERMFRLLCEREPPSTSREILDRYFTAFFTAWLDLDGARAPKRWIVGFGPRLAWQPHRDRFFADYPAGRHVGVVRDPRAWWASAARHSPRRYGELEGAIDVWLTGARELIDARRERPEQTLLIAFEALVERPKRTMRRLSDWLGIAWDPVLLQPTMNRQPVQANSSYAGAPKAVSEGAAERWRELLTPKQARRVAALTADVRRELDAVLDVR